MWKSLFVSVLYNNSDQNKHNEPFTTAVIDLFGHWGAAVTCLATLYMYFLQHAHFCFRQNQNKELNDAKRKRQPLLSTVDVKKNCINMLDNKKSDHFFAVNHSFMFSFTIYNITGLKN